MHAYHNNYTFLIECGISADYTVDQEILAVKIFSSTTYTDEIKHTKYFVYVYPM